MIKQGLAPIECNFQTRYREIDLILRDQDTLVFVEVRSRGLNDGVACRFDVIAITGEQIQWIKDAFEA